MKNTIVLNTDVLTKMLGRKVYWTETLDFRSDYLRIHYDQERYLSDCEDIPKSELISRYKRMYLLEDTSVEKEIKE